MFDFRGPVPFLLGPLKVVQEIDSIDQAKFAADLLAIVRSQSYTAFVHEDNALSLVSTGSFVRGTQGCVTSLENFFIHRQRWLRFRPLFAGMRHFGFGEERPGGTYANPRRSGSDNRDRRR